MTVIDASAIGAILLEDHDSAFTAAVENVFAETILVGPTHLPVEVMNLLVKARRKDRLTPDHLRSRWLRAAEILESMQLEASKVDEALLSLAERTGLTPRDAAYVELASRREVPLCSADKAILRACRTLSIKIIAPHA